jgi:hypothetical protein
MQTRFSVITGVRLFTCLQNLLFPECRSPVFTTQTSHNPVFGQLICPFCGFIRRQLFVFLFRITKTAFDRLILS